MNYKANYFPEDDKVRVTSIIPWSTVHSYLQTPPGQK